MKLSRSALPSAILINRQSSSESSTISTKYFSFERLAMPYFISLKTPRQMNERSMMPTERPVPNLNRNLNRNLRACLRNPLPLLLWRRGLGRGGPFLMGVIKTVVMPRDSMECGGKRSATPLWLERLVLRWIRHKRKPKRRRASLAAALHMAVTDSFNRTLSSCALFTFWQFSDTL